MGEAKLLGFFFLIIYLFFCLSSMFLIFGKVNIEKLEKGTNCLRESKEFFVLFYVVFNS